MAKPTHNGDVPDSSRPRPSSDSTTSSTSTTSLVFEHMLEHLSQPVSTQQRRNRNGREYEGLEQFDDEDPLKSTSVEDLETGPFLPASIVPVKHMDRGLRRLLIIVSVLLGGVWIAA